MRLRLPAFAILTTLLCVACRDPSPASTPVEASAPVQPNDTTSSDDAAAPQVADEEKPADERLPLPSEILGLVLNQPINVPECVMTDSGLYNVWSQPTTPCWQAPLPGMFPEHLRPKEKVPNAIQFEQGQVPPGVEDLADPEIVDGLLAGIVFKTNGAASQHELYKMLVTKYGEPDRSQLKPVQNAHGADYQSREAYWSDSQNVVHFFGISGNLSRGYIVARSATGQAVFDASRGAQGF